MDSLDFSEIQAALSAVVPEGTTFEVRALGTRKGQIDSGYFNSTAEAANAIVSSNGYYQGVYVTPNPVQPELMARSYNRITPWAKTTTNDPDVVQRNWVMVDVDPIRPSGISSSDEEHEAALKHAKTVAATLSMMYGFPEPLIADSGNGAHIMYRVNWPNTDEVRDEVHLFLRILRALFGTDTLDMDTTVFNAARIWRVYGTYARKGDSIPERPHRRSKVIQRHDAFKALDYSLLLKFNSLNADKVPNHKPSANVGKSEYPDDEKLYRRLNEYAMHNMKSWVTHFFPTAREYKEGYRVASDDIGESYEEDLTIHPYPLGIKYFGVADQDDTREGRRTPIGIIAEYSLKTEKTEAATALSSHLNFPLHEFTPIPATPASQSLSGGGGGMGGLLGETPTGKFDFKNIRSIADLQRKEFKEIKWVVDGVIPTGNIMLASRPKMRKTWLALQLSMAIASGRQFLGYDCIKGDVLFLGLEDNERRLQNRIRTLQKFELVPPDLSGFRYWTGGMGYDGAGRLKVTDPEEAARTLEAFPRGDAGVEALEQYLDAFPNTNTIVIDTLQHFRGDRKSRDIYASDYEAMMPLTKLAARREICVIPVHHEKKGNADRGIGADFLEDVSGSAGITGGVDGVISIKGRRGVQEENESRKILISGRDIPFDYELDVAFDADTGGWKKAAKEDVKVAIRGLLTAHPFLNKQDMGHLLPNAGQARLYRALMEMKLEGEIEQSQHGYSLKR